MNANEREYTEGTTTVKEPTKFKQQQWRWWLNVLLVVLLFSVSFWDRMGHTRGDLWQDEAEYALASTHPVADQRWDRSDVASEPLRLVRLRHFHPPMTAYLLRSAQMWGKDERTLRTPFVIAGSLVVCLVYLCGLRLFGERVDVSLTCAVIVLVTPLQIRASSHAIPWAEISLGIMAVLWTLLQYIHTTKRGWLIGLGGVLGWLFCTTESFFPILLAVLLSMPFVLNVKTESGADTRLECKKLLPTFGSGGAVFLVVVLIFWPAGLLGGAWGNIQHYAHLPANTISAVVGGVSRNPIPKWAFLYWFSHDYKPYFVLYVLGAVTMLWQIVKRRLSRGAGVLLVITVVEITVAHLTVEFGPQYLAHCLPLLTLMTGFGLYALVQAADRVYNNEAIKPHAIAELPRTLVTTLICCTLLYLGNWHVRPELRITDEEAQISRWPDAARFLAGQWQPGDKLVIGPQPVVVPRWYLLVGEQLPIRETQISELPQGRTRSAGLQRMAKGDVRFAIINSTFDGNPNIDEDVRKLLATWLIVYRSPEPSRIPPRLVIYERP